MISLVEMRVAEVSRAPAKEVKAKKGSKKTKKFEAPATKMRKVTFKGEDKVKAFLAKPENQFL